MDTRKTLPIICDPAIGFLLAAIALGVFVDSHHWNPKNGDSTVCLLAGLWGLNWLRQYLQLSAPNFGGLLLCYAAGVMVNVNLSESVSRLPLAVIMAVIGVVLGGVLTLLRFRAAAVPPATPIDQN